MVDQAKCLDFCPRVSKIVSGLYRKLNGSVSWVCSWFALER